MNNEPVAWMHKNPDYPISKHWSQEYNIPLYTHPVKELNEEFEKGFKAGKEEGWKAHKFHHPAELTDEEIKEIAKESYVWNVGKQEWSEIDFAKAILRKASEK